MTTWITVLGGVLGAVIDADHPIRGAVIGALTAAVAQEEPDRVEAAWDAFRAPRSTRNKGVAP